MLKNTCVSHGLYYPLVPQLRMGMKVLCLSITWAEFLMREGASGEGIAVRTSGTAEASTDTHEEYLS